MFFIPTKINYTMINILCTLYILCTLFPYKNEGGSCDSGHSQALKVIIDLYIYNFHDKPLYICILVK